MPLQKPGAILNFPSGGEPKAFLSWTPVGATAAGLFFPATLQIIAFQKLNCAQVGLRFQKIFEIFSVIGCHILKCVNTRHISNNQHY
ncbi:MAG: hypothetical protein M2R45_00358 [Verrucomicrobia subdivision 3 bacterium]|nr:hypothetical protein [Limisphaerales bacterium]MCS1412884.1 hypothetical protein [Limisphaerales bacterium]